MHELTEKHTLHVVGYVFCSAAHSTYHCPIDLTTLLQQHPLCSDEVCVVVSKRSALGLSVNSAHVYDLNLFPAELSTHTTFRDRFLVRWIQSALLCSCLDILRHTFSEFVSIRRGLCFVFGALGSVRFDAVVPRRILARFGTLVSCMELEFHF